MTRKRNAPCARPASPPRSSPSPRPRRNTSPNPSSSSSAAASRYGDYVTSGRLAQLETERFLGDALHRHHAGGGLLLGICNGFQILTKLGILPDSSLIDNKKERFECVWAKLVKVAKTHPSSRAFRTDSSCPLAHAEGRLVTRPGDAEKYLAAGNVALQYVDNRDGCECSIAGLQDSTGRAMGLMPHPERFSAAPPPL